MSLLTKSQLSKVDSVILWPRRRKWGRGTSRGEERGACITRLVLISILDSMLVVWCVLPINLDSRLYAIIILRTMKFIGGVSYVCWVLEINDRILLRCVYIYLLMVIRLKHRQGSQKQIHFISFLQFRLYEFTYST